MDTIALPTQPATPETDQTTATVVGAVAVTAGALLLAGCGGGGGGGRAASGPLPPAIAVSGLTIAVTTSSAASVTIGNVAPVAPAVASMVAAPGGRVRFALNGGTAPTNGPKDPGYRGAEQTYDYAITATDGTDSATAECYVTVNPAVQRVLTGEPVLKLKHLLNRMAFAATPDDLARWQGKTYDQAVDAIIDEAAASTATQLPTGAATYRPLTWNTYRGLSDEQKKAYDDRKGALVQELNTWWLKEIVISPHPLREKMALFWHNLLVVSAADVFEPRAIWDYLDLLRRNALGNYGTLIREIARDPAMIMFLDSDTNVKGKPNENFARELMELFTLGEGQVYTEQDVVAVARCFTGWSLDRSTDANNQTAIFKQVDHDTAAKTVLGQTWSYPADDDQVRLDGEKVLDLILAEDRVATFICEKIWDEFIGGTRDNAVIGTLAATFRSANYAIVPLLKALFKHVAFTAPANRGNMLRSPIELHTAIYRTLGIQPDKYSDLFYRASDEDQTILNPPNVRGWIGGLSWISTRSLLARREHLGGLAWDLVKTTPWKIPDHAISALPTIWFAIDPADPAYIAQPDSTYWGKVEHIKRLLIDPALNCK